MQRPEFSDTPDATLVCMDSGTPTAVYTPYPQRPAEGKKWITFTCNGCNLLQRALICSRERAQRELRAMKIKVLAYRLLGCAEILGAGLLYVTGYWPYATALIVAAAMFLRGSDKLNARAVIYEGIPETDYAVSTSKDWFYYHRIYLRRFR